MNFFVTNREIINNNGKETIREDGIERAGDNLRFGTYDIKTEKFTLFPEPEKSSDLLYDTINENNELKGSALFFQFLYAQLLKDNKPEEKQANNNGDVLFFIHGFNTDLGIVRNTFKHLNDCYVNNPASPIGHIVMFTWPGKHPAIPYHYIDDAKDAERSGAVLGWAFENKLIKFFKEFLNKGGNEPCGAKIHMMVHSMGNRVLKHMLLNLKAYPEVFQEILIMAADVEWDVFDKDQPFYSLIDLGQRVHIYYHEKDHVLDISKVKNFSNRLGRYGRKNKNEAIKDVIDANTTKVSEDLAEDNLEKKGNHFYYYTSTEVIKDVINVLNGKKSTF